MMANKKFQEEAAFRNRVAILIALVAHLLVLGVIAYRSDIQELVKKSNLSNSLEEVRLRP